MLNRRQILATGAGVGVSAAFGAAHALGNNSNGFAADILIANAKVITMDPAKPVAQAILVKQGRIAFVGDNATAKGLAGTVPMFDAAGRTVLPGFIDGHTHLEWFSESMSFQTALGADLTSLEQMFAILRKTADAKPKNAWVIGRGTFDVAGQVVEKAMPTREQMDSISTDHPVVLFSSVHVASLNTRAFKLLGLWTEQQQRALKWRDGRRRVGTVVHRDANGLPSGVVTEVFDLILDRPLYPFADRVAAYGHHAREDYVSKGLTTIVNISGIKDHIQIDQAAQASGKLPLRIRMFHIVPLADTLDHMLAERLKRGAGDDMYRFAGVKFFVDGEGGDGLGHEITDLKWTQAELDVVVNRCNAAGYPIIFHVVTKGGFDLALNSIERAQQQTPRGLRHQIHHLGSLLANPRDRSRVKALNVTLGLTRSDHGEAWPETIDYRGLLDEGINTLCVSDSAGSFRHFSTLEGIASLVAPPSEGGVLKAGRSLSFAEALGLWTVAPAVANYEIRDKGTISVGKLADLSIISGDPTKLRGGELFDLKIDEVFLGGCHVYSRNQNKNSIL